MVDPTAYVAPTAVLCGDVQLGAEWRVLFGAVLTAEEGRIDVGAWRHAISSKDGNPSQDMLSAAHNHRQISTTRHPHTAHRTRSIHLRSLSQSRRERSRSTEVCARVCARCRSTRLRRASRRFGPATGLVWLGAVDFMRGRATRARCSCSARFSRVRPDCPAPCSCSGSSSSNTSASSSRQPSLWGGAVTDTTSRARATIHFKVCETLGESGAVSRRPSRRLWCSTWLARTGCWARSRFPPPCPQSR